MQEGFSFPETQTLAGCGVGQDQGKNPPRSLRVASATATAHHTTGGSR